MLKMFAKLVIYAKLSPASAVLSNDRKDTRLKNFYCLKPFCTPYLVSSTKNTMAKITLGGNPIHTNAELPAVGSAAPAFTLTGSDLQEVSLADFKGQRLVLNIFPSIDTNVCAASVRRFNQEAAGLQNTQVLNMSRDLPFAHKRFCAAEGLDKVLTLAEYKSHAFGDAYGVAISDSAFAGLLARAVVVLDAAGVVIHSELVPEIGQEPDYAAALAALK